MKYNIFSSTAPAMPSPSKGTEFVRWVLSQASRDMREVLLPMVFPALAAHLSDVQFTYSDNKCYQLCGQMGHLIGASGTGKGQLSHLVEVIMASARQHDEAEMQKLAEWQRLVKTKGANREKPERPDVAFWFPPSDVTAPAFLQNAMALERQGGRTQYLNLPEVEMADRMCGGHRQVSQMVRNIYDCQRAGALRATADGVTGNPVLRVCLTFTSTPDAARQFYRKDLTNGFFGRIPFAYKPRGERSGRIPRQGTYGPDFVERLQDYLARLEAARGCFTVSNLNRVANRLAEEMARLADLTDDDTLWELSHRSIFSAWKKGAILWLLNGQKWTSSMGEMVTWFCYFDLWSKVRVFGDMFRGAEPESSEREALGRGPRNMLDSLPDSFGEHQLVALRLELGKAGEGAAHQLSVWKARGFITRSAQTGLYTKTPDYLAAGEATRRAKQESRKEE